MNKLPDFLIIPSIVIRDEELQPLDWCVYGVVYWYTKLKLEKCIASSKNIADILNVKPNSVDNAVIRLVKKRFLMSIYNRQSHTRELIPQVTFTSKEELEIIDNPSNKGMASPQMMKGIPSNDVSTRAHLGTPNKKIKEEPTNVGGKSPSENASTTKKTSHGMPDINEGMALLKELFPGATKLSLNRFALKRLITKHGKTRSFNGLRYAYGVRSERYAPKVYNWLDLEEKWEKLQDYGREKMKKDKPTSFELSQTFIERN